MVENLRVSVVFGESGPLPSEQGKSRVQYQPVKSGLANLNWILSNETPDIFHIHGLWSPLLHKAAGIARREGIPYVVSPRGMMSEWAMAHRPLRKMVAWNFYQAYDLRSAQRILPSSNFESADVQRRLPHSRCDVMPNGCDPRPAHFPVSNLLTETEASRWALALGRLHPVKGYAELLEAWAAVRPQGWKLAIAGPDENGYRRVLESLVNTLGLSELVTFTGAVNDLQKWSLLDQCELFVAPSRTENFGMSIAEAMQSGKPVVTTTGTPWRLLPEKSCGWWVKPETASLKSAIAEATGLDPLRLSDMGAKGRQLILEQFSWASVVQRSLDIYRSAIENHESELPI